MIISFRGVEAPSVPKPSGRRKGLIQTGWLGYHDRRLSAGSSTTIRKPSMVIDFQSHLFPEEYLSEMARIQGNVILEAPDSNYPYGPEEGCLFVKNSLGSIEGLWLKKAEKDMILGGNAARVLKIGSS